jgi:hypothetical protein
MKVREPALILGEIGNRDWLITYEWISSFDSILVNTTDIYTARPGNLFVETTFSTVTLNTNNKLDVNYYCWVS